MKHSFLLIIALLPLIANAKSELDYHKTERGIQLVLDAEILSVEFYSPTIIRVLKSPLDNDKQKKSLTVTKLPENLKLKIKAKNNHISVSSKAITVHIDALTAKLTFHHKEGVLVKENNEGIYADFDDAGKKSYKIKQAFSMEEHEIIYGLGQVQNESLDQNYRTVMLKNSNHDITIPYIYSPKDIVSYGTTIQRRNILTTRI